MFITLHQDVITFAASANYSWSQATVCRISSQFSINTTINETLVWPNWCLLMKISMRNVKFWSVMYIHLKCHSCLTNIPLLYVMRLYLIFYNQSFQIGHSGESAYNMSCWQRFWHHWWLAIINKLLNTDWLTCMKYLQYTII